MARLNMWEDKQEEITEIYFSERYSGDRITTEESSADFDIVSTGLGGSESRVFLCFDQIDDSIAGLKKAKELWA